MMHNAYMFGSRVLYLIFGNIDCTLITTKYRHCFLFNSIILYHLFHPKKLCTTTSCSNVFRFSSRQGCRSLLFTVSCHQIISNKETSTRGTFPVIYTFNPISIRKTNNDSVCIFRHPDAIINCTTDVLQNSFHCTNM